MNFKRSLASAILAAGLLAAPAALATELPNDPETVFTATVSEQITVSVPTGIAFDVTDTSVATAAAADSVTVTEMALIEGNHLRISLAPNDSSFSADGTGNTTWDSSDISWNAATGTAFTGSAGTMSAAAATFVVVGTCTAGVNACSTDALVFTLAPKPTVNVAGAHTLSATWKFESL